MLIRFVLLIEDEKKINIHIADYSGYYCYDEQYIKIEGRKSYRLTLFDSLLNIPVAEEIAEKTDYKTVYSFLRSILANKPLTTITTDHVRMYKGIIEKLGALHQLCILHIVQIEDLNEIQRQLDHIQNDRRRRI